MKQTPTFHRDRTVTWWDASYQGRRRTSACDVTRCALAKMTKQERCRIAIMIAAEMGASDVPAVAKLGDLLADFLIAAAEAAAEESA